MLGWGCPETLCRSPPCWECCATSARILAPLSQGGDMQIFDVIPAPGAALGRATTPSYRPLGSTDRKAQGAGAASAEVASLCAHPREARGRDDGCVLLVSNGPYRLPGESASTCWKLGVGCRRGADLCRSAQNALRRRAKAFVATPGAELRAHGHPLRHDSFDMTGHGFSAPAAGRGKVLMFHVY